MAEGRRGLSVQLQRVLDFSSSSVALAPASGYWQNLSRTFRLSMMMETFEIKRENDGTSLGKYRARSEGKLVSEVLEVLKKNGLDGTLLKDDTMILSDSDLLTP